MLEVMDSIQIRGEATIGEGAVSWLVGMEESDRAELAVSQDAPEATAAVVSRALLQVTLRPIHHALHHLAFPEERVRMQGGGCAPQLALQDALIAGAQEALVEEGPTDHAGEVASFRRPDSRFTAPDHLRLQRRQIPKAQVYRVRQLKLSSLSRSVHNEDGRVAKATGAQRKSKEKRRRLHAGRLANSPYSGNAESE